MDIKQLFGEMSRKEAIGKGDRVIVKFTLDGETKIATGILLEANESIIKINGTMPITEIKVSSIISIEKANQISGANLQQEKD